MPETEEIYNVALLPEVEVTASAPTETIKKGWEQQTNEWALLNPQAIFKPKYRKQRAVLTDDTWRAIIKANNITDPADKRFKMIPTKFLELAMLGDVRRAINENGTKVALGALAVPGAMIGSAALANPVLSLMVYHPGTFLAETALGAAGGYVGGKATDAATRAVSDYNSFADMVASNSTIPELYAEMLNPGMLLGGLAGGVGGNVLYNNVIKPSAKKTITGYLAARGFNKSINENLGRLKFHDSNLQKIPLVKNYLYHETPGQQFNRDGSRAWPSIGQLDVKDGRYVSARKPHGNNPDKIWWDSSGHNTGTEVYVKPKENELNVLENIKEINYSHGSFSKDYYISDPVNVNKVIKYKKDPITNQYNISVPGKTVTNKTLDPSNLDYVEFNLPSNAPTSLKFYYNDKMLPELEKLGLLPNTHLLGDDAALMFKEYLNDIGDISLKESVNVDLLKRYIPEVRERYGLVGNNNITDDEILKALYHHTNELGKGTAAVNVNGEPLLLFRGSTSRHDKLIPKGTSELPVSGADNILGNLFLGELPGTVQGGDHGIARYLGLNHGWLGPMPPQTRAAEVILPESKILDKDMYTLYTSKKFGDVKKLPGYALNTGYNDINAFIVRTPNVRDATEEIVVINPFNTIPEHKRLGQNHSEHYRALIKDAESKNQGLIHSKPVIEIGPSGEGIGKFRDEHEYYNYFALPNFNIQNAKHILPYDLRIPRNWEDPIIYRKQGGTINYLNLFK